MALRLMQIVSPECSNADMVALLEGHQIIGSWRDGEKSDCLVVHLLIRAEETESIMDKVEQRFSGNPGFHLVLYPIEAVLPRPAPAPEAPAADAASEVESPSAPQRVSREELHAELSKAAQVTRVYLALTVLSSAVAAIGLVRDDLAIIIGAMVIAPCWVPTWRLPSGSRSTTSHWCAAPSRPASSACSSDSVSP